MTGASLTKELAELGFRETAFGRRRLYLAPEIADRASSIDLNMKSTDRRRESAFGNRRSAVSLDLSGLPLMFMRHYRRGGMMRFLISDFYVGQAPRPLHELVVTAAARKRGLPVVEPLGASVEWLAPGLYRGWFITRALAGQTLWELLHDSDDRALRRRALDQAFVSIGHLHEGGLFHADLNFQNLFVCVGATSTPQSVVVLDLDKARLFAGAVPDALRRSNFHRLERSARRLAAAGGILTPDERAILGLGT